MAGRKTLRSIRMARETANGTRTNPRYLWRGMGDWVTDDREVIKVEELIGISGGADRTYIPKLKAQVEIAETEATYKQLPALFYSLGMTPRTEFGVFGTRTPSVYTTTGSIWRYGLNIPSTVFPTNYSYTVEAGDNIESQVGIYCVAEEVNLNFEAGESAKMSANMIAQYGTRTNAVGSFSAAGTLEAVTVVLSSKTAAVDITPVEWSAQTTLTTVLLRGVFIFSSTAAWAVGDGGIIQFYNGATLSLTAQTSGTTEGLYGVWGTAANSVWAVGTNGTILFYDGTSWGAQTSGTTEDLRAVWGSAANSVWAVGTNGTIRFYNGSTWASQSSGSSEELLGVWGSAANSVWAVGTNGTILFYNGSAWASQTSGTTENLLSVWGSAANSVWAVGANGTILFYDGSAWAAQTSGTSTQLHGVRGVNATNVWAVGNNGTIRFYNGTSWGAQTSITNASLRGVWIGSTAYGLAVGENGNVLVLNTSRWVTLGGFANTPFAGNVLKAELTFKALWAPKYWVDGGIIYPGTMVLTGHEITGNLTFEHQTGGSISGAGTSGQIEKWRNQQAQVLNMLWTDTDSFGSEVAFGVQLPFKWDTLQEYDDMDGNNIVSGDFTSKYNETYGNRGFLIFHTGYDYSNIVGTI